MRGVSVGSCISLVSDNGFEFLGGIDVLLDFLLNGGALAKVLCLVDFKHLGCEVCRIAGAEFLYGINTGCFEKFGELGAYTLDAEEVCMVDPGEDEIVADAGFFLESLATLCVLTFFQKLIYGFDACSDKLFSINGADTLNVDDFVSHNL